MSALPTTTIIYKGVAIYADALRSNRLCSQLNCLRGPGRPVDDAVELTTDGPYQFCPEHYGQLQQEPQSDQTVGLGDIPVEVPAASVIEPQVESFVGEPYNALVDIYAPDYRRDANRELAYMAIDSERAYQRAKGTSTSGHEHYHELESFALYMEDYMHELRNQLSRIWVPTGEKNTAALATLRKVAALAVAAMEMHGAPRREGY